MTTIEKFPDELLVKIFSFTPLSTPVYARVCTRWRDLIPEQHRTWTSISKTRNVHPKRVYLQYIINNKKSDLFKKFVSTDDGVEMALQDIFLGIKQNNLNMIRWMLAPYLLPLKVWNKVWPVIFVTFVVNAASSKKMKKLLLEMRDIRDNFSDLFDDRRTIT